MHRLALLLLATSACVANSGDEGFSIVHNLAPGANCATSPGGAFLSRGTIDVTSPNPYIFTPEFESRITADDGASVAQRTIALRGANIEVLDVTGTTEVSLGKFRSLFSASLGPSGRTTASFDIITPPILDQITVTGDQRVQLIAKITPYGALGGSGDEIDGVPFQYPVSVCNGCVAQVLGPCPLDFGTTVIDMSNSCNKFQDGFVTCCDSNGVTVCPGVVATQPPAAR